MENFGYQCPNLKSRLNINYQNVKYSCTKAFIIGIEAKNDIFILNLQHETTINSIFGNYFSWVHF